jgi:regulator of protease activity HflC (stomatin/prohibitin superfamily)
VQALIDFLIRNVMAFWPMALVRSWQRGLRVRLGIAREELEPGVHWRVPFVDEIICAVSVEDMIDLPLADIPTKDGKTVTFSANIAFRIVSPRAMWLSVYDVDENLARLASGKLATLVTRRTWMQLQQGQQEMRNWLRDQLTQETKEWGIEVTRVFITNLSVARQVRLLQDAGSE